MEKPLSGEEIRIIRREKRMGYVFASLIIIIDPLIAGIKTVITETVQKKEAIKSAEAGSGALFIPILGNLFPKLWGQEMKETTVFNLVIGSVSYNVEEEIFARVEEGSAVKMHFAPNSKVLLKVENVHT